MFRFDAAPWPRTLWLTSLFGTLVVGVASWFAIQEIPHDTRTPFAEGFGIMIAGVLPLVLLGALLFVVRGYELDARELRVQRLLWSSHIGLTGLTAVWHDPAAMERSLRVFGNGGLYSFTGLFQSRPLGRYRAFVTDPRHAVVLRLGQGTLVISPREPGRFVERAGELFPRARTVESASGHSSNLDQESR